MLLKVSSNLLLPPFDFCSVSIVLNWLLEIISGVSYFQGQIIFYLQPFEIFIR